MRRLALCLPLLALALVGCDTPPLPGVDPEKGREVLKSALDTWVRGGTPDDLKPVVVVDPDWKDGAKLTAYEVDPENAKAGVDLLLKVKLKLQKKDGTPQEKSVNYVVGMGAQTAVLRYNP